ncbi:MAG TPA: PQQ-dependent sugar dehydrogenase, partial [Fimbriimonas sp.]|nr:PQQ-dependent sugar dehydrogenase [Fimbriimonas sp.]
MMNPLYVLAGVATLVSCSMIANSTPTKPMDAPAQQSGETIVRTNVAKRQGVNITGLYNDTCAKCHGTNGEGGGGGTKSLLTVDKFHQKWDRAFFDATRNGVPEAGMEGYGATMSDEEIWGLVVHIRELQNKAIRGQTAPKAEGNNYTSKLHNYRLETVVDASQGLKTPWSLDWLPDGKMLVTNRPGYMSVVVDGKVVSQVSGMPRSVEQGQGGLMEVAVHPDYAKNGWIYLSLSDPAESGRGAMTKIVRGKLSWNGNTATWVGQQTLFQAPQDTYTGAGVHFGSKIAFDGKGHVFFSCGDRGQGMNAQDVTKPNGKVYRINEDGSVPSDNPFIGKGGVADKVWSYGHRNPQGLTIDGNGRVWDTEHAPRGGDELNLVQKG